MRTKRKKLIIGHGHRSGDAGRRRLLPGRAGPYRRPQASAYAIAAKAAERPLGADPAGSPHDKAARTRRAGALHRHHPADRPDHRQGAASQAAWPRSRREQAVHQDVDVSELAREARRRPSPRGRRRSLLHQDPCRRSPRSTSAASRPVQTTDDARTRRRVAVVVVDHRFPEACFECAAEIKILPSGMRKVRGALRRDHAVGARRSRRVEADGADAIGGDAGARQDVLIGGGQRLDRDLRSFGDAARALDQLFHAGNGRRSPAP